MFVRCVYQLLANNNNADLASVWLMDHMGDADINDPIPAPGAASSAAPAADPAMVEMLCSMLGITARHASQALQATGGSIERAADYALSHPEEADAPAAAGGDEEESKESFEGKYALKAIISHIGSSPQGGHYVCHILKDGQWAFFNDASVARAEEPPIKLGFMYLYERLA